MSFSELFSSRIERILDSGNEVWFLVESEAFVQGSVPCVKSTNLLVTMHTLLNFTMSERLEVLRLSISVVSLTNRVD